MNQAHPHWNQIAGLRVKLAKGVRLHRQEVRGQLWYVLQDSARGRYYRFNPEAYLIIGLLDGQRTIGETYEIACERCGDTAATQDDVIRLLAQLHYADALQGPMLPNIDELIGRGSRAQRAKLMQQLKTPLAIRIPLFDPGKFLETTKFVANILFSRTGFFLWLCTVGTGLFTAIIHWDELSGSVVDRVLAADNLLLLIGAFVGAKILHEFGHGYAIKRWGGETHEMGIMFLVFVPIPYVEASNASALPYKWQRAVVGAAGMYVELMLASLCLFVWLQLEPGMFRSLCFNVVVVASISTLLFNANPLLKFDGYYIFSDFIEIPNLGSRSIKYFFYLIQKYVLLLKQVSSPALAQGEAVWLFSYAVSSFLYRTFVIAIIALFVAQKFFIIGVLLAVWTLCLMFVLPVYKGLRFMAASPILFGVRTRSAVIASLVILAVMVPLFAIPAPLSTQAQGVVWPPAGSEIATESGGFVAKLPGQAGGEVCFKCVVAELTDPEIDVNTLVMQAKRKALLARYQLERTTDLVKSELTFDELKYVDTRIKDLQLRKDGLVVRSPAEGTLLIPYADDLIGRFLKRGEIVGYVYKTDQLIVRALVDQDDIGLLRDRVEKLDIRLAGVGDWYTSATIARLIPAASSTLPSMALSTQGGGTVSVDPQSADQPRTLQKYFELTLRLDGAHQHLLPGQRAFVRIKHGSEPFAFQLWRRMKQLFLRELAI